jgi:tetratricopeptide (TPR) repeat protein
MTAFDEETLNERRAKLLADEEYQAKRRREAEDRERKQAAELQKRKRTLAEAPSLIRGDQYPKALRSLEELFANRLEIRINPETRKEEEKTVEPPVWDPRDKSLALTYIGHALIKLDRTEDAVKAYSDALADDDSNSEARRGLAGIHFEAKDYAKLLEVLRAELETGRRDAALMSWIGKARYEQGVAQRNLDDLEAARLAFEAVLVERPDHRETPEILRLLALASYQLQRFDEAAKHLEALLKRNPLDSDHLVLLGRSYLEIGERQQAYDVFELAASVRPPSSEDCRSLAQLAESLGHPARAAEWLAQAHRNDPKQAGAEDRFKAGSLFADASRDEEAAAWLGALQRGEPRFGEAQARLVEIHRELGRADDAIAAYEVAAKERPQDGAAHVAAGRVFMERAQYERAVEAFSRATSLREVQAEAYAGLAEIAWAKGSLPAASHYFRKALELRPGQAGWLAASLQVETESRLFQEDGAPR